LLVAVSACASAPSSVAPRLTQADETPWVELRRTEGSGWSAAAATMSADLRRLEHALRNRTVHRGEGFAFGQLMLGPGALHPYHSHGAPEAYHVLSGEAEWSVDGETRRVGPGTTIYHAPWADHRWVTVSPEPLRVLWAQWAPDGDRSGLVADGLSRRGGSTTGTFLEGERRSRIVVPIDLAVPVREPEPGSVIDEMRRARLAARRAEPKRPPIRTFVDSVGVPWNTEHPGVRWRMVFVTPDLEWGHLIVRGPGQREVPAGAAPSLLHVLSGRAAVRVADGPDLPARPGTTIAIQPGEFFEVEFASARGQGAPAEPLRAVWVRWAPGAEPSDPTRGDLLVEPPTDPPIGAALPRDVPFFPTRETSRPESD
jgi:quercetin dioxygenase-like cupin family protein